MDNAYAFNELIALATEASQAGDWEGTLEFLQRANEIQPEQGELLSAIGGTLIQLGRYEEALAYYQQVVTLQPQNAQGYLNLGNVYLLLEQYQDAEQVFRKGLEYDEDQRQIWMGLARACLNQGKAQEGVEILAALVTSDSHDVDALALLAECYEEAGEITSADFLYRKILEQEPQNDRAQSGINRLKEKEKVAVNENIQRLAQKLRQLKTKINEAESNKTIPTISPPKINSHPRFLFCGPAQTSVEVRFTPLIQRLFDNGNKVKITTKLNSAELEDMDIAVFSKPHISEEFTRGVEILAGKGVKVVVDLDEDFAQIPPQYYGYEEVGAGNRDALNRLDRVLKAASIVTVPNNPLAEIYRQRTAQIRVLPYAWDETNPQWTKLPAKKTALQLGIISNHTQAMDIAGIDAIMGKVVTDNPSLLVGIVGNLKAYEALTQVSDERKYFIPPGKLEDYPYLLAEFDVLLFPLADIPYNQSRPDLALMEAGARSVAWVATPIPSYVEWGEGGLFAKDEKEWESALELLLHSEITRQKVRESGWEKAQERRSKSV
ncbi:MAG: tetratricopeptide repeat protein, partial [Anaerolineales bacterium]